MLIELIVNVQVCVRELFYGRKRLLDCFISLKPHGYRLDILSICADRGRLMIGELVEEHSDLKKA
jgi:hypothetical protein